MIQTIPLFVDQPSYSMRVSLSGTDYVLRLDYCGKQDRWYLDLHDAKDSPIVQGLKCLAEWPLLRRVADSRRPPGELVFTDFSGTGAPPTFADMGRRVQLAYIT